MNEAVFKDLFSDICRGAAHHGELSGGGGRVFLIQEIEVFFVVNIFLLLGLKLLTRFFRFVLAYLQTDGARFKLLRLVFIRGVQIFVIDI